MAEKDRVLEAMALIMQQLEEMMIRHASPLFTHRGPVAQDRPLIGMELDPNSTEKDVNIAMGQNG